MNREIVNELCRALMLLGAKADLLGTVGSWGDSLPESMVLADLRYWNEVTEQELRDRILPARTSCPLPSHSQSAAQEKTR